jgi:septal ring factor EnvC (AmiA/AmiB activator)
MQEGLQQCKIYKDEQERLTKANAILAAYLKSMGDLAADKLTNFDKNIEGFGKAATAGKLLDDSQSTAIMGLAKVLSHIAAEGYRRKKLRDVIKETNSDIQAVTSALSTIVSHNYELQLENERVAMQAYYAKLTQQEVRFNQLQASAAQATLNALQKRGEMSDPSLLEVLRNRSEFPSPAVLDDLKTSYETKNAAINVKKKGAEAYVKILKNVGEGHQKLYDNADKLSSREVLSTALSYAKTIEALAGDFQKAF